MKYLLIALFLSSCLMSDDKSKITVIEYKDVFMECKSFDGTIKNYWCIKGECFNGACFCDYKLRNGEQCFLKDSSNNLLPEYEF